MSTGTPEPPAATQPTPPDTGPVERGQRQTLPPDPVGFWLGAVVVLAVVVWGVFDKDSLNETASTTLDWVLHNFGWLFVVAADLFVVLAIILAVGRFARITLGADEDEPEFTTVAWVAMMFSAGMGIGLMFYGVAEPLTHFATPRPGLDVESLGDEAARAAMETTLFHWTLHPWAIYAVAGLALAYATFRKHRGNRISAAFVPLIGERRANGGPGRAIDLLAVFATVFGSATSLGLGALQMAAGLDLVTGVDGGRTLELIIIGSLTAAFVVSAFSGVHRGVKWLSTTNMLLAVLLLVFVFVLGPTVYILDAIPASIGGYVNHLLPLATSTGAFSDPEWLGTWTVFYWAWWLSWAPFVGTFIARISRGRTVRQFIVGVLLVPSGASCVWFAILGGSAIRFQATGEADLAGRLDEGPEAALFGLLDTLPLYAVTAAVAVILVELYFVSGADAASLVLGSLSSSGSLKPGRLLVVTWGVLIGAVAAVLPLAGGLPALQQATILVALPFVLVMLALCVSLVKELRDDPGAGPRRGGHPLHGLRDAIRATVGEVLTERGITRPHQRLRRIVRTPRERDEPDDT